MLDLPNEPVLDKQRLIGACTRLPVPVNLERLTDELGLLPDSLWGSRAGRIGVHRGAEAIFLRGYAPAEGNLPIEDRAPLQLLKHFSALLHGDFLAPPMRCLLAKLPPLGIIAPHIDLAPYFAKTVRIHIPLVSNAEAHMYCAGQVYCMRPGEVWAINNRAVHAVWNAHASDARVHLICDFLPSAKLLGVLAAGERDLGVADSSFEQRLMSQSTVHA